jgi:hypothetical protein
MKRMIFLLGIINPLFAEKFRRSETSYIMKSLDASVK